MELTFHTVGSVELTCDRSLEQFDYLLDITDRMIYKYGAEVQEIDENVMMITRDTPSINVAQLIYEFILLSLPLKKIHPDHKNALDEEDDNSDGGYVYLDEEADPNVESFATEEENTPIDPRWAQLSKLKNKE
jgi:uncharacterized metal-binding protein YceD (DUF177 family)